MGARATGPRLDITVSAVAEQSTLAQDVARGFTEPVKVLSPKHFYDARGCELFDEICTLEEYYPTRTEHLILAAQAHRIVADSAELVELGAGSATKTRVLLDAMRNAELCERYVPFDIAEAAVRPTAEAICEEYPELGAVHGVVGDFNTDLGLIPEPLSDAPRLVALLGSTIGNFTGTERQTLLTRIAGLLRPQDRFVMGADLVKDPAVLQAAYDDAAGVTAAFNRNVLTVVNRELGGNIPVENFDHVARYDPEREWIEMRLRAREACRARLEAIDLEVQFAAGEELRTEISAKFTRQRLSDDLAGAGLALEAILTDPEDLFALALARPAA